MSECWRDLHAYLLRIIRDYDRSICLTGYVFSELTANVFWLVFCCGMLRMSKSNVHTFYVQLKACRDNLQRLGHCIELNRIWASLIPGEPLIRKEYYELPEGLEAMHTLRTVKHTIFLQRVEAFTAIDESMN